MNNYKKYTPRPRQLACTSYSLYYISCLIYLRNEYSLQKKTDKFANLRLNSTTIMFFLSISTKPQKRSHQNELSTSQGNTILL